jgi:CheY-like chemotaxis protein
MRDWFVLVVDDDVSCRDLLKRALEDEGFRVTVAADGRAALRSIEQRRPDLILLDLEMPVLSGYRLFQRLAANPQTSRIPVVVITGVEAADLVIQARAILPKPINLADVIGEVTRQLKAA